MLMLRAWISEIEWYGISLLIIFHFWDNYKSYRVVAVGDILLVFQSEVFILVFTPHVPVFFIAYQAEF